MDKQQIEQLSSSDDIILSDPYIFISEDPTSKQLTITLNTPLLQDDPLLQPLKSYLETVFPVNTPIKYATTRLGIDQSLQIGLYRLKLERIHPLTQQELSIKPSIPISSLELDDNSPELDLEEMLPVASAWLSYLTAQHKEPSALSNEDIAIIADLSTLVTKLKQRAINTPSPNLPIDETKSQQNDTKKDPVDPSITRSD
jgi:hypothetical protein